MSRTIRAVLMLCLLLNGCGGDATTVNPAPFPNAGRDGSSEAAWDASSDATVEASPDAPSEAIADVTADAEPDVGDSSTNDVDGDVALDAGLPDGCAPGGAVPIEARVQYGGHPRAYAKVIVHCPDGGFGTMIETDANGIATLEVPVGGLVTAQCPGTLITVGGIEESGSLELACINYTRPPGSRPPGVPKPCEYTVLLTSFSGAAGYLVRGNGGEAESADTGPITLNATVGVRDIVAYALDGQSQRIAAAAKLDAYVNASSTVALGAFVPGVYPASLTLIHPRVENAYEYTAALETWRVRRIEREKVVVTLEDGQAASLSTQFADDIAHWNVLTVHYEDMAGSDGCSSDLTIREPTDNLPYEKEIDLTTGMLPLMFSPSLSAATRPVLDFDQDGPATCVTGSENELIVKLLARHPSNSVQRWHLYLPGETSLPWTLPELESAVADSSWPGEQMELRDIEVVRQTPPDPATGVPICVSRLTAHAPF